jgi:tetratricopeptide (TPR) repeat protein
VIPADATFPVSSSQVGGGWVAFSMTSRWPVVEIFNPARRMVGSGFLLGERLVLTARQVVDVGPTGQRCSGRTLCSQPGDDWIDLDLCAVGAGPADDIALLEFRRRPSASPGVLSFGQVDRDQTSQGLPCCAVGFPVASARPAGMRDPSRLLGRVAVGAGRKADELIVAVDRAIASLDDPRDVAWAGTSGAALVARDHVVGVLTRVVTASIGKELSAVPVTRLLADPEARRLLVAAGAVDPHGQVDVVLLPLRLELEHRHSVMVRPPTLGPPLGTDARAHPSQLLDSDHALVDFVPRPALAELEQWCAGPERLRVRGLLGEGGAGKSRLAAQLCQVQEELGWDAGIADESTPGGRARQELSRPTLIVVDDAERQIDLVVALLDRFALAQRGPSLRVLLLARSEQVWWEEVNAATHGLGTIYETPALCLDTADPLTPEQRQEHLLAALRAFGRELGLPPARVGALPELVDLEADDYANPLLVHIAALLACLDPWTVPADGEGDVRAQLLTKLLATERRRWNELRRMHPFGLGSPADSSAGEAVAVMTLTTPRSDDLARQLVGAVPGLDPGLVAGLVDWLHVAYPAAYPGRPAGLAPVRPGLLADQLLGETPTLSVLLVELTRLALGCLSGRPPRAARILPEEVPTLLAGMLWEATRAGADQPAVRHAVGTLLQEQLPALVRSALDHPESGLAPALVAALRCAPAEMAGPAAAGVLDLVSHGGPYLGGLPLEVAEQGTAHLTVWADLDPGELAGRWRQLSGWRARARRRGPAVVAAVRAVRIAAAMDLAQPAALAAFARALDSLAERLRDADHPASAVRVSTRAADLFTLAVRRGGAQDGERATALTHLAAHRAAVGRDVAALAAATRAVKLYEDLPPKHRKELGYGQALHSLSLRYAEVGDHPREALDAAEACVTVFEWLHKGQAEQARPDRRPDVEYRPRLADALTTLALRRSALARHERAAEVAHRAVELAREMVPLDPLTAAPILGRALTTLAWALSGARRPDEALPPAREAVAVLEQLTSDVGRDHVPALAAALVCTADVLARRGDVADALDPAERAVDLYRNLVETDRRRYLEDLVDITVRLVSWYAAVGEDEEATWNRQQVAYLRTLPGAEQRGGLAEWCRGGPDVGTRRISRRRRRDPRKRRS